MNKITQILVAFGFVFAFSLGLIAYRAPVSSYAAALYHTSFNQNAPTAAGVVSVTTAGALVISDTNLDRGYLTLDNSGATGVSCFPSATTTGFTYGGGWWLAANGGTLSFDGVTIYGGVVSCLTGTSSTTIGFVER